MRRVLIIEAQLKQYRRRFIVDLAARLRTANIALQVAYSDPPAGDRRADTIELDGDIGIKIPSWSLFDGRVLVQRAWRMAREADLAIVEQSNKLVLNTALLALSQLGVQRVAYWGHGYNHQAIAPGVSEWFKRKLVTRVDWWFAYTPAVARYLVAQGVAPEIISTVYNTIDVDELAGAIAALDPRELGALHTRLGITPASRVGLFCGALVADKQLGFLVDAAAELHRLIPTFELVVVGDGPERAMLEAIAHYRPYIHVVGPAFGAERAKYFAIADVCMIPALVGLAAVDAFAAGLPLMTTAAATHGPEIEYVEHGRNGVVSAFDVDAYARAVAGVLGDRSALSAMRATARRSADGLGLAQMVERFADGIVRCMELA
jgi:glycosyltransferase involved in cell wall biosynthesis